jgi:hypothetical protein
VAFVPDRDILDNALTTFEVLHYMMCKSHGKEGLIALKLDVNKDFNRVKWSYLQLMMQNGIFNFHVLELSGSCGVLQQ